MNSSAEFSAKALIVLSKFTNFVTEICNNDISQLRFTYHYGKIDSVCLKQNGVGDITLEQILSNLCFFERISSEERLMIIEFVEQQNYWLPEIEVKFKQ